ncbi:hypothetical protein [Spirosoma foliorum]|uniref:hypothetical protein n=1 Tax=Spirosoma foliorum TaxID=2710596 RepID=UPI00403F9DB5
MTITRRSAGPTATADRHFFARASLMTSFCKLSSAYIRSGGPIFEPPVFVLQFFQPFDFRNLHAAVFSSSIIKCGLADSMLTGDLSNCLAAILLLKNRDNLRFLESSCFHFPFVYQ